MKHLKKILSLVLVMAMTFTMLPVFAAADDVAVETVAPAAADVSQETGGASPAPTGAGETFGAVRKILRCAKS